MNTFIIHPQDTPTQTFKELSLQIDTLHAEIDHYSELRRHYHGVVRRYSELERCCEILGDLAVKRLSQLEEQIPHDDEKHAPSDA